MSLRTLLLLGFLISASSLAYAEDPPAETLDVALLKAGAIVFADVQRLATVPGQPELVEVELAHPAVVASRFAELPTRMRLRAQLERATEDGPASTRTSYGTLIEGGRYLFFLNAGEFRRVPFGPGPEALFEVDPSNGRVRCATDYVLGIDATGIACGPELPALRSALDERELLRTLQRAYEKAEHRRPKLASELSGRAHTFAVEPTP